MRLLVSTAPLLLLVCACASPPELEVPATELAAISGSCVGMPGAPTATGAPEMLALLPGGVLRVENVTYGHRGGYALQGDLYVPSTQGVRPGVLVVVHGGGWADCGRRRQAVADYAYVMALLGGFATYNVEYRLLSEGGAFPENVRDIKCAVQWLREAAPRRFGIDGSRVGISGESAGAQLALMVGLTENRADLDPGCGLGPPDVNAVVAYSPPTDLPDLKRATSYGGSVAVDPNAGPCSGLNVPACTGARASERCVDASPTAHACNARDRVLLVQAPEGWDLLLPFAQSAKLQQRLAASGALSFLLSPRAEELAAAGCAPEPNRFAHGFAPCLTDTTGSQALNFLRPVLAAP